MDARRIPEHAAADPAYHMPLSPPSTLESPPTSAIQGVRDPRGWGFIAKRAARDGPRSSARAHPPSAGIRRMGDVLARTIEEHIPHPPVSVDIGMQTVGRTAEAVRSVRRSDGGERSAPPLRF